MPTSTTRQNRWKILAVLSLSLVIIGLDNTVMNVALPSIQEELGVSGSTLQWIVDAYMLVFAGLLLAAGNLGDRHGRKLALQSGLLIFGLASVAGAFATSGGQLIGARAAMGVGGALIMPSTLSIIMDVFPQEERGKAMSVWAGMAAIGVGLGPLIGGTVIEIFSWPAVFWINVPVVLAALALGLRLVPESRDPRPGALDTPGVLLSIAGLGSLVWAIIEAPERGWTDGVVLSAFVAALVLGVLFVRRQRHTRDPLLDVGLFKRPAFSFGSLAVSSAFFALFGLIFLMTQYLQFVQGRSAIQTGLVMLPLAFGLVIGSGLSHKINLRLGTPKQVSGALTIMALVIGSVALWQPDTPVWLVSLFFFVLPLAMGSVMAPATVAVMSAVPEAKAGVGSAMNDVNRQVAGALGVAVIGSISSSIYSSKVEAATAALPKAAANAATDSVGGAAAVAAHLPAQASDALTSAAHSAFTDAIGLALLVGSAVAVVGAMLVRRYLPDLRKSPAAQAGIADHHAAVAPSKVPATRVPDGVEASGAIRSLPTDGRWRRALQSAVRPRQ
jgi:MFS transporter, DHA2 family, multidrug resistance protein